MHSGLMLRKLIKPSPLFSRQPKTAKVGQPASRQTAEHCLLSRTMHGREGAGSTLELCAGPWSIHDPLRALGTEICGLNRGPLWHLLQLVRARVAGVAGLHDVFSEPWCGQAPVVQ